MGIVRVCVGSPILEKRFQFFCKKKNARTASFGLCCSDFLKSVVSLSHKATFFVYQSAKANNNDDGVNHVSVCACCVVLSVCLWDLQNLKKYFNFFFSVCYF